MTIAANTFAHACIEQNILTDLREMLNGPVDERDCYAWGLTGDQWRQQIAQAIEHMESAQ